MTLFTRSPTFELEWSDSSTLINGVKLNRLASLILDRTLGILARGTLTSMSGFHFEAFFLRFY